MLSTTRHSPQQRQRKERIDPTQHLLPSTEYNYRRWIHPCREDLLIQWQRERIGGLQLVNYLTKVFSHDHQRTLTGW